MADKEYQYAVLRVKVKGRYNLVSYSCLLEYTSIEEAAKYMKANNLVKVDEKRFEDCKLVQWIVQ